MKTEKIFFKVAMIFNFWLIVIFVLQLKYCAATDADAVKTVDLSDRGLQREDFFIKLQHQIPIHEVTELILRGNKFDTFIDCATHLDNLRILDLSYNNLKKFLFLCQNEYNLESLNVSHNQIEYINDEALTHRVVKLKILDLSYNDIFVVNDTMLQNMKNLEFLSLASNPIGENIDAFVFMNLTKLRHLDLRNISSPYFSPSLFEPLTTLEYLDLSLNPIEDVPPLPTSIKVLYIGGTNIIRLGSFIMPQLHLLSVENSPNLTSVLLNNFENLTELQYLYMNDSPKLSQIRLHAMNFNLLPKLKRFSLKNCALETLHPEMGDIINKTAVLDLQDNPWKCDCHMKWLARLNLTSDLVNSFRCQTPLKHHNKLLWDVPVDELECEEPIVMSPMSGSSGIIYPILWSCLVLTILGLISAGVVYYSRGCLGQWVMKMRHRRSDTVSYTNVVESNNDLVRILPVSESNDHNEA